MLCGYVHNTIENDYLEMWTKMLRTNKHQGFQPCGHIYNVGCMMPWMQYTLRTLDQIIQTWETYHQMELD